MVKINFLDYSDIVMDRCPTCGSYWLDKNELANMHKYIKQVEEGSHQVKDVTAYDLLASNEPDRLYDISLTARRKFLDETPRFWSDRQSRFTWG